jgi:hypothetical protein
MSFDLAQLTSEQERMIDQLEQQLGCILIAYDGYNQEDEEGKPKSLKA